MTANRIVSESVGDQTTGLRKFHATTAFADEMIVIGRDAFAPYDPAEATPVGREVIAKLATLPGFVKAYIDKYEISLTIGDAFRWEEDIEPAIIETIALAAGWTEYEFERRDDAWPHPERDQYGDVISWRPLQEANYSSTSVEVCA